MIVLSRCGNSNPQEAEGGGLQVQSQYELHSETLFKKKILKCSRSANNQGAAAGKKPQKEAGVICIYPLYQRGM
jgi:hypothetical protein